VIGILKTFDPAIPNDLVVYFGLRKVREMGIKSVMTGDGADEFFAGYSFMEQIEDLGMYIKQISLAPVFSSNVLGNYFKQIIVQPFLEKEFVQFALEIPSEFKVREEIVCGSVNGFYARHSKIYSCPLPGSPNVPWNMAQA